jgi:hypothetical protein
MIQNPVTVNDYSNPYESVLKHLEHESKAKILEFQSKLKKKNKVNHKKYIEYVW